VKEEIKKKKRSKGGDCEVRIEGINPSGKGMSRRRPNVTAGSMRMVNDAALNDKTWPTPTHKEDVGPV
jgi:hypothetical protein